MVKGKDGKSGMIGVIHARGGSKRVPFKNIALLGGKPLVSYMIKAALGSKYLNRVIVSTDHPEIKRISLEYGAEVPFTRPPKLAEDCPSEWVTRHAVEFVEAQEGGKIDIVVTMQPTAPFCTGYDIDRCVELLLNDPDITSAFSAKVITERPEWMFLFKENSRADLFLKGEIKGGRGISQELPKLAIPNGGIYATRRDTLFDEGVIISKRTAVHIMPFEKSVDIDEAIDLEFANLLMKKQAQNK
ncbi:MAG: acylneuraminate cytidylyltransferase family protein [Candidatus Omnitrophota bacterium]|jgi:CMP-N-acetylneuraminic acid synthetase